MKPLSLPEVSPRPGGHEFYWKSDEIFLRLERIREHHDSITSEIWVEQGVERAHLIGGLRFNLTTPTGRGGVIKSLSARRNGVDWGGMIEQVCIYALRQFREQELPVQIGYFPKNTGLSFCLAPVIPLGVSTLLFGYGGMAKTTIAMTWGLLVQLGESRLGLKPRRAPIMLLDWETNQDIANSTLVALHAGMKLDGGPDFLYRRCRRPLLEFVEDVKADICRAGIELIILDSMGKACGGEKELRENALPTMSALEWLGVTNLIISHRPKGEMGKGQGSYGSVYVENDVRQAFRVEAQQLPGEKALHVALTHTKHNLMAPLNPIGYKITWDKLIGTQVEDEEVAKMDELRSKLPVHILITSVLENNSRMTVEELATETGREVDAIRKALKRGENKFFVQLPVLPGKDTQWGLKTFNQEPLV